MLPKELETWLSLQSFKTAQARDTVTVADIECTFWTKIRSRRRANTLSTQQQGKRKTVQRPTCKKVPPASYINPRRAKLITTAHDIPVPGVSNGRRRRFDINQGVAPNRLCRQ